MDSLNGLTALRVNSADQLPWDDRCDLLIVGFGGAGACAAIEASTRGLSVLALDRFEGGGATALSGGVVYAGGGTPYQRQAGYEDTSEAMFNYLRQEVGEAVSHETLRNFCDGSREQLAWLERQGAAFEASVPPHKTSYPSDQYYLYYSGNEAVPAYAASAKPAPRGHRTKGPGMSGASLFAPLKASALRHGARLRSQCEVRRLVLDLDDKVIGVEAWQLPSGSRAARQHARLSRWAAAIHMYAPALADRLRARQRRIEQTSAIRQLIRAEQAVLLSSGGFIFNRDLVRQHAPQYLAGLPLGATGCNGSGIALGQSAGGSVARMDKISAWRFINPPLAWARGLIVNARGQRYANEEIYGATLGHAMVEEQDGRAILVLNRELMREALRQVGPGKVWNFQRLPVLLNLLFNAKRSSSLAGLAKRCNLPPELLRQSVERYSRAARGEVADEFGKSAAMLANLDQGPWYALDLSFDSKLFPCPVITLGGLKVCEDSGRVLDHAGQPINGLYSAGRNAVGVASNLYVSGLSLADCIYSGRRAAAHVADQFALQTARSGEQQCNV
ncbi:delta 4, 5-alpha steroid dehydrogenase [Pseudomonas jessenii]|uniref:3-oxo-5alpha-steroid 4-dehydrogenase n=2 Tax=Pseudomonas TaxID=286 RepID=A0A231G327_PSEJE|nr:MULTISPECIES: FAD-binding protein [Pseudomonas]OXR31039.1 delta 4, 5-alpha steroid dehydrogenase [Pseudomonas jessenii]SEC65160.1 3-oxo-5alpha-steroid 4-dehydrogenase [Pseudomonas jessenii]VVP80029.1 3-oxo-5-alpha-steroid 4-dehydrogenase [Pseudomonas fluorescens]